MIILELNWIDKTPFWIHPLSIPEQNIKKSKIIEGLILPEASSHHYSLFLLLYRIPGAVVDRQNGLKNFTN